MDGCQRPKAANLIDSSRPHFRWYTHGSSGGFRTFLPEVGQEDVQTAL